MASEDSASNSALLKAQASALNRRLESALSELEVLRPTVDLTSDDMGGGPASSQPPTLQPSGLAQMAALQSTLLKVKKERDEVEEEGQGEVQTCALFIDRLQGERDELKALICQQQGQMDELNALNVKQQGQIDTPKELCVSHRVKQTLIVKALSNQACGELVQAGGGPAVGSVAGAAGGEVALAPAGKRALAAGDGEKEQQAARERPGTRSGSQRWTVSAGSQADAANSSRAGGGDSGVRKRLRR